MDLTFQIPMQYCSLQHRTLLLSPVTSTTGYCVCFGSIPSFLLELFLHWSPVAYWAPTDLESSSFKVISFCLFILFMGFSRQEYWSCLSFPISRKAQKSLTETPAPGDWQKPSAKMWAWLHSSPVTKITYIYWLGWMNHKLESRLQGEI